MDDPLIWVRAIHFAAAISVSGVVFFLALVGGPAFRVADKNEPIAALVRWRLASIAWLSLALVVFTGVAWLVLLAAQMSERPLAAMWSEDIIRTVLLDTDFGHVWLARSGLTALLAVALSPSYFTGALRSPWRHGVALTCATALVGTLAFWGHAAAGSGVEGVVQKTADALHLVAAAAWAGALVPLALLLGAAANDRGEPSVAIAREATLRFSTLGAASVATVLASGIVNSWELAGSVPALFGTDYGHLLSVKVALFFVMLSVAAVNRLRLTPRLIQGMDASARLDALRQLRNNSLIEASAAGIILLIVGVLGTLPPGLQEPAGAGLMTARYAWVATHGISPASSPTPIPSRLIAPNDAGFQSRLAVELVEMSPLGR